MDATLYEFKIANWPPPDDRKDPRFYLFGFDEDGQPYIVKWCNARSWQGWRAISLDDHAHDSAEPIIHALVENNADKIKKWADAPLRWSQPLSPLTGGQSGIQDRVYIIEPDGERRYISPARFSTPVHSSLSTNPEGKVND